MSLYGSFEIGKKSLTASQLGQSTTGHNIANVDTEGYSRQQINQTASRPSRDGKGTGVDINGIRRMQDGFTKTRVIEEQNQVGTWKAREKILAQAEAIYTDLEGNRLRNALDEFWNGWSSVANEPESVPLRKALLEKSTALARNFHLLEKRLTKLRADLNGRIAADVAEANQYCLDIAKLNKQIEQLEHRDLPANDSRDRRDVLLRKLSDEIEIKWFENPNGILEVQLANGQNLVHGRKSYRLIPKKSAEGLGDIKIHLVTPPKTETDVTEVIRSGAVKEYINQRDGNIRELYDNLNGMVVELASRINRIHSGGTGINGARRSEAGVVRFNGDSVDMPVPMLHSGTMELKLLDENNRIEETLKIEIEAGVDTLGTIAEKINRAADAYEKNDEGIESLKENGKLLAQVTEEGTVSLFSGMGKKFIYGEDATNTLAALGLNCFFHFEKGAADIRVNPELAEDEMQIAAGSDLIPGDNRVALQIAELAMRPTMVDDTVTFNEFYGKQALHIGLKVQDARRGVQNHSQMLDQYEALSNSVSAVNLDEEMTNMVKYQRAYESSAKFLSTIDEMTQTVINM